MLDEERKPEVGERSLSAHVIWQAAQDAAWLVRHGFIKNGKPTGKKQVCGFNWTVTGGAAIRDLIEFCSPEGLERYYDLIGFPSDPPDFKRMSERILSGVWLDEYETQELTANGLRRRHRYRKPGK